MFWDFGSIHMFVTQNAAGDEVKESSHRVSSSRNSSSSEDEQLHSLASLFHRGDLRLDQDHRGENGSARELGSRG